MKPAMASFDSFKAWKTLHLGTEIYTYYSMQAAEDNGLPGISALPISMKILLENLLRFEDGRSVSQVHIEAVAAFLSSCGKFEHEVAFRPARVLTQDFAGVPAIVDLAAMRDAMKVLGSDPARINPTVPVDLVMDHSLAVEYLGNSSAFKNNVARDYERSQERYRFTKWGQSAFDNFRVMPPGTGICHQVNLEYPAQTVWTREEEGVTLAYPDTVVGTASHTTMINGLGVLGWGVGGIEAEASMLGQPNSMLIPEVIGFRLTGQLPAGVTATDLVLTITQILRKKGVVGKFVEFFGQGLDQMTLEDKATIGNMAPEYGATCGFFPVDAETLKYLDKSGRDPERVAFVEAYCRDQVMFRTSASAHPVFTDILELDLATVRPSLAGPKRPQDRMLLSDVKTGFLAALEGQFKKPGEPSRSVSVNGHNYAIGHGAVTIAAITSCTNCRETG